jgi:hypothetical protein
MINDAVVIQVSKLVKDNAPEEALVTDEVLATLEQVVQELVGDAALVEVNTAEQ